MISWLMIPTLISVWAAEGITKLSCLSSNDSIRPAVPICHGSTGFEITFPECIRASASHYTSSTLTGRQSESVERKTWRENAVISTLCT